MLDTVGHIKSLEAVGFNREQAEAQVQLVYKTLGENVASKEDIAQIRSELSASIAQVRSEMATKTDLAAVRSDMAQMQATMFSKMAFLFIASMTATTTIIGILIKF